MLACPACRSRLAARRGPGWIVYPCPGCGGRSVGLGTLLSLGADPGHLENLWSRARAATHEGDRRCPHCRQPMARVASPGAGGRIDLDICPRCEHVWFDRGEMERLNDPYDRAAQGRPVSMLQVLLAAMGLPVEHGVLPARTTPWITWGAAAACAGVMLLAGDLERLVNAWGFVPRVWDRHGGLTILAAFFLHGGWLHLASNLYFLVTFGDNVEDVLGKARYVLLLAAAHVAGLALHGAFDPRGDIPCVGASAGISGVMACYVLLFPRARVGMMGGGLAILWGYFTLPVTVFFGFYLLMQFVGASQQIAGFSGVSSLAHLGGIAAGLGAGLWMRARRHA